MLEGKRVYLYYVCTFTTHFGTSKAKIKKENACIYSICALKGMSVQTNYKNEYKNDQKF